MPKSHGMSRTRLHNIWLTMRQRCQNPNCSIYYKYGAKGIAVCSEWEKFENFRDWSIDNGYSDILTLDRIDPAGNYEPCNCRWATQKEQQNNRSNNVTLTYKDQTRSIYEWSKITGISPKVLYDRKYRGRDISRIFSQKVRRSRKNGCYFVEEVQNADSR